MKTKKKKTKTKARVTKPKARVKAKAKKKVATKKKIVAKKKVKVVAKVKKVKPKAKAKKRRGFTLIEMMIVVAIIGVLATVVLVAVTNARKKSNATQAKGIANQIMQAMEMWKANGCVGTTDVVAGGFWRGTGQSFVDCNGETLIQLIPNFDNLSGGLVITSPNGMAPNTYAVQVTGFSNGEFWCMNGSCMCTAAGATGCTSSQ